MSPRTAIIRARREVLAGAVRGFWSFRANQLDHRIGLYRRNTIPVDAARATADAREARHVLRHTHFSLLRRSRRAAALRHHWHYAGWTGD